MKHRFEKILFVFCFLILPSLAPAQGDFKISKEPTPSRFIQDSPVLFLKPGGFLVAWRDYRLGEPAYFAQEFDSLAAPVDTNFQVLGNMAMAFLPDGRAMVLAQFESGNSKVIKGQVVQGKQPVAPPFEIARFPYGPLGAKARLLALTNGFLLALGRDSLILRKFNRDGQLIDTFEDRVSFPSRVYDFSLACAKNGGYVVAYFSKVPPYGVYATFFDEKDSVVAKSVPVQAYKTMHNSRYWCLRKVRAIALTDSIFEFFWGDLDSLFFKYASYSTLGKVIRPPQKIKGNWQLGMYDLRIKNFHLTNIRNGRFGVLITISAMLDIPTMPDIEVNNTSLAWYSEAGDTLSPVQWKKDDLFPGLQGKNFFLVDNNESVFSAADSGDVFLYKMKDLQETGKSKINADRSGANQRRPEVVLLDSSRFLVTWEDETGAHGQIVSSNGGLLGDEIDLEGTRVVLLNSKKAVNLWKKTYWDYDWKDVREKVGFTLYRLPDWKAVYSRDFKSGNESILKIDDKRFMLAYCQNPYEKLLVISEDGRTVADTTLSCSCGYFSASEDSTFWYACQRKFQPFSFDLQPLTPVFYLKINPPFVYMGNGQFLSVGGYLSIYATVLDTSNLVKRSFLLKKNISWPDLFYHRLVRLDQNKFLFLWGENHQVFGLSFSSNRRVFLDSLAFLSQTSSSKSHLAACTNGRQTLFAWADNRDWGEGYNIYGHLVPTSILTGVGGFERVYEKPQTFVLFQNYPNPFNPNTAICYELPKRSYVTVVIYDVEGRLVETLVDEEEAAGRYSVTWHAANQPSGVYFYRIRGGQFPATKKLLLLK